MEYTNQILDLIGADSFKLSDQKPSDWAEEKRFMSTEVTSMPGPFRYRGTDYLREIVDCLAPGHPSKIIAVMKGAQVGFSAGLVENGIGWIIDRSPGNILLLSGDEQLSKEMMETRIDQMLQSSGLRKIIGPNVIRKRNQRTGDTSKGKEFPGGKLIADSVQKANKMKQRSVKYGFIDDFDNAPASDKKEGNLRMLIEQRFSSYDHSMKLFYISTPLLEQTSNIEPAYLLGDQRRFYLPCPCCGVYIFLEWRIKKDGEYYGITYDLDDGKLVEGSTAYRCQECGDKFKDSRKMDMLGNGEWRPTTEPSQPNYYSYHISALYAPPWMYGWEHYVRKYLEACPPGGTVDKSALQSFYNVVLGKTWKEQGQTVKVTGLMEKNIRDYKIGVIPDGLSQTDGNGGIVMITCSCDLNGTMEDSRLDWEILAHSEMGPTYSIDHGSIGTFIPAAQRTKASDAVDDQREKWTYERGTNSVWPVFDEIISKAYVKDNGGEMNILVTAVDTGHYTIQAYDFMDNIDSGSMVMGVKGAPDNKARLQGVDMPFFKIGSERDNLYIVEVNQVKNYLSDKIALKWNPQSESGQPSGFMNFPEPADGKYSYRHFFKHYESEHYIPDKSKDGTIKGFKWEKKTTAAQNHFWDIRVYNDAIREIFISEYLKSVGIRRSSWKAFVDSILDRD